MNADTPRPITARHDITGDTAAKWREMVRFELNHQLRRRSTWFVFALFLFPLIGVTSDALSDAANREILYNAPLSIAEGGVLMGLIALLVLAGVAGDAATRDVRTGLEPLMHATPVGRAAYVGGRFLGAFAVALLLLAVVPLVRMLLPLLHGGLDAEMIGPFRPAAFAEAYFLLIVPNAFVAMALMFALAMLVRHTLGSYAVVLLVFVGAQFSGDVVGGVLGRWDLAQLLDSTGVVALEVISRTWSPVELNERLIGSASGLLWHRLLWLALAVAVLVLAFRRFDFGADAGAVRWWQRGRFRPTRPRHGDAAAPGSAAELAVARNAPVAVPRVPREFGAPGRMRQALSIARDSLREVATPWIWLLVPFFALRVALILGELSTMGAGTPVVPTTDLVLGPFEDVPPPVILIMVLLPIVIAGEVVWRERDANMQALADAAPVPDGVWFVGKLLGLWLLMLAFSGLLMLAGVASQLMLGWYDFDFALYFQILFGLQLVDALVFALFALSVHVLVNQKHIANVLVLLFVAPLIGQLLGIEHPLLLIGSEPGWRHSPISGFGPFLGPVLWFELYWAAWALLLALVVRLFRARGVELGLRERARIGVHRFRGRAAGAVLAALGLVLLVGGFIFYNTNILNAYQSTADGPRRQAGYERLYKRYQGAPQPQLIATELHVELYPERRAADVRGVHHLVNLRGQPIDTVHVAVSSHVATGEIEFGRPARAALIDDEHGHRIYVLDEPLQPGDSLRVRWQVRHEPRGFPARDISTAVVGNGSFILMPTWTPLIGYQPRRELSSAGQRREHGLASRPAVPSLYDIAARSDSTGRERIHVDVTIGTAEDQTAVGPGELLETWTRDDRRYFRYATTAPIGNEYAIFSARYAVRRSRWRDVALEILHHPAHDLNVQRMMRGMEASLEQFTARFGPYPYGVLRMVEYPAAGGSLHAEAANIWYQELFSLFDTARDPRRIDLPFAVVAHEVAHQWWGGQGARVEGIALLSESLAWYSAMGVIEREYGTEHLARFLGFMREYYLRPRSRADVPLLRAADFFLAYRKGPFAMYALREYVGEESVDVALRRLQARFAAPDPPFATSLDLYHELREVTPDSLRGLLADLFERNTFWELEARRASMHQTADGEWLVSLDVEARKVVVDTAGAEADVPMDDLVEIGVFAPVEDGESQGATLHLAKHRIRTGPQTITITVPRRPARAGIDPRHLLIDVAPQDNVVDIPDPSISNDRK